MKQLAQALDYARARHQGQYRRPEAYRVPYYTHPLAVVTQLHFCGVVDDEPLLVAAALHDVLEDTLPEQTLEASLALYAELVALFGADAAQLVNEASDDLFATKEEKHHKQCTYAYGHRVARLKIADKTCNVRDYLALMLQQPEDTAITAAAFDYASRAITVVMHLTVVLQTHATDADIRILLNLVSEFMKCADAVIALRAKRPL